MNETANRMSIEIGIWGIWGLPPGRVWAKRKVQLSWARKEGPEVFKAIFYSILIQPGFLCIKVILVNTEQQIIRKIELDIVFLNYER